MAQTVLVVFGVFMGCVDQKKNAEFRRFNRQIYPVQNDPVAFWAFKQSFKVTLLKFSEFTPPDFRIYRPLWCSV